MPTDEYKFRSDEWSLDMTFSNRQITSPGGIQCIWSAKVSDCRNTTKYTWQFNWDELRENGVTKMSGFIIVRRPHVNPPGYNRVEVEVTEYDNVVEATIVSVPIGPPTVYCEFSLIPEYSPVSYDYMFAPSDINDAILVIEGKKIHVNKAFLSIHSEFFRALFSSNFKEGKLAEIPIGEVTYEDFGLLMSTIYPDTVYPTDRTVEKLLELADRFLLRSVISHVEHHLLKHSKIENERMIWMADRYGMKQLLEKTIRVMDTVEKAKSLQQTSEYKKISDATKVKIFERILKAN